MIPIFPEEELCIMIFKIIIKDIHIEENLLNAKLVRTLHHSSGTITTTNDFIDIFRDTMLKNEIITTDNKFNPASRGKQYSLS